MRNAARFNALCSRLRLTRSEVAAATGYSLGYVAKWGHGGTTAINPPDDAVERLAAFLHERELRDLADTDAKAA